MVGFEVDFTEQGMQEDVFLSQLFPKLQERQICEFVEYSFSGQGLHPS